MAEQPQPNKPVLQKPPGYRDPANPGKPVPRPPPRNGIAPLAFRQRKRRTSCCRMCCCIFFISFFILLFIFLLLAGVFYIWFEPKIPSFHLQSFKITKFTVTAKDDGTYLNAVTVARMEVKNPNSKITYHYGVSRIDLTVGKDGETEFGSTSLPGFTQAAKNKTSLKIEARVNNELVEDNLASKLNSQFKSNNLVVNLRVKTSVGVRLAKYEIGMLAVYVGCDGLTLKKIDGGDDDMLECTITTLKWVTIH